MVTCCKLNQNPSPTSHPNFSQVKVNHTSPVLLYCQVRCHCWITLSRLSSQALPSATLLFCGTSFAISFLVTEFLKEFRSFGQFSQTDLQWSPHHNCRGTVVITSDRSISTITNTMSSVQCFSDVKNNVKKIFTIYCIHYIIRLLLLLTRNWSLTLFSVISHLYTPPPLIHYEFVKLFLSILA